MDDGFREMAQFMGTVFGLVGLALLTGRIVHWSGGGTTLQGAIACLVVALILGTIAYDEEDE